MRLLGLSVYVLVFVCIQSTTAAPDAHLYVSPTGSDSHDGKTLHTAVKTISHALSLLSASEYHGRDVFIELAAGYHDLGHTLDIRKTSASHVTIRSLNGSEVHVTGGKRVPGNQFKHVTNHAILARLPAGARSHVRVIHLPDVGVTSYPDLTPYGFGKTSKLAPLEVFYNGIPLRIARWPNVGFINIVGVPDGKEGLRFQYNTTVNRPQSWTHENNVWAYGYWYWGWADRSVKVSHIDAGSHTVTLTEKALYGLRTGHWNDPHAGGQHQGGYFKFINVLSELDQPGEYYMDRSAGNLYVWMPNSDGHVAASDVVYVSNIADCVNDVHIFTASIPVPATLLSATLLWSLHTGVSNIVFSDFTLEVCRGKGIVANAVHNVQVLDMEIRNTGGYSMRFGSDNRNCVVARSILHDGDGGISMSGGHRSTLESSGNLIEDNEIVDYAREGAVGYHGISVSGVGNIVRYNHVHRGQYTAIWYMGNNNVMEHNHIHHICQNASDCGALHTGRDWTSRGNLIRYNIVHDTHRLVPGADVRGVMLDDQASGTIITNNVFYKNQLHVNIGGGRDNVVSNNVFYDADSYSMGVDGRGIHGGSNSGTLFQRLHAMPVNSSLWTSRYPPLAGFESKSPGEPRGNQITKNIIYNTGHKEFVHGLHGSLDKDSFFNDTENGFARGPGDFFDTAHEDYRVTCLAADWANKVGFVQPPTPDEVGPRVDIGPSYKRQRRVHVTTSGPGPCTTNAPSSHAPMPSYLPDGARNNTLVTVPNHGCWLSETTCTDHGGTGSLHEDTYGEAQEHTGTNETMCLERAAKQWRYCGSHSGDEVTAVYGPTGAMTVAGAGCYFANYGCPKHGGPADGHVTSGGFHHDTYAEQHRNGSKDEEGCLSRAHDQWVWCGSSPNHPVTSLFRPTGNTRTAGAGCWIHFLKCPQHPELKTMFYDDWGATNLNTDSSQSACFARAQDFWEKCGSDRRYRVTAYYRPRSTATAYPA